MSGTSQDRWDAGLMWEEDMMPDGDHEALLPEDESTSVHRRESEATLSLPPHAGSATGKRPPEICCDDCWEAAEPPSKLTASGKLDPQAARTKANREKQRRATLNCRYMELAALVEPGKQPKTDRNLILEDAIRVIQQLRAENNQLHQLNKFLEEKVAQAESERSLGAFWQGQPSTPAAPAAVSVQAAGTHSSHTSTTALPKAVPAGAIDTTATPPMMPGGAAGLPPDAAPGATQAVAMQMMSFAMQLLSKNEGAAPSGAPSNAGAMPPTPPGNSGSQPAMPMPHMFHSAAPAGAPAMGWQYAGAGMGCQAGGHGFVFPGAAQPRGLPGADASHAHAQFASSKAHGDALQRSRSADGTRTRSGYEDAMWPMHAPGEEQSGVGGQPPAPPRGTRAAVDSQPGGAGAGEAEGGHVAPPAGMPPHSAAAEGRIGFKPHAQDFGGGLGFSFPPAGGMPAGWPPPGMVDNVDPTIRRPAA